MEDITLPVAGEVAEIPEVLERVKLQKLAFGSMQKHGIVYKKQTLTRVDIMEKNFDDWNHVKKKLEVVHKPPFFNEREIWWCSIGMNIGSEVYGKGHIYSRPVLILKKLSKFTFLGVPLTSKRKDKLYYHPIAFAGVEGSAIIGQIRIMDNKRLSKLMGTLGKKQFEEIRQTVKGMI